MGGLVDWLNMWLVRWLGGWVSGWLASLVAVGGWAGAGGVAGPGGWRTRMPKKGPPPLVPRQGREGEEKQREMQ